MDYRVRLAAAEVFGRMAFKRGVKCASALDTHFMPLLKGLRPGEALPVLTAWQRGWTEANLEDDTQGLGAPRESEASAPPGRDA